MTYKFRTKKLNVLYPEPRKISTSLEKANLTSKQKANLFLKEADKTHLRTEGDELEDFLIKPMKSHRLKPLESTNNYFSPFHNERNALGYLLRKSEEDDQIKFSVRKKKNEHLKTKIIKENMSPNNMVLVKRNNFYFFEKGAQMKSQNSLNLLEKCFSKTFDKEMSILNSNSRVYTNPQNIFFDSTIEKPTNSLDSVFMNSFTVNKITPTKKLLEILKLSENFQESNKIFENYRKFKQKNTIKTRFTQKEPLFSLYNTPPVCLYDPDYISLKQKSPAFKFTTSIKTTNEKIKMEKMKKIDFPPSYPQKRDSLNFERDFARIMRSIKEEVNLTQNKRKYDDELDVKIFDDKFLPIFHNKMTKSFKSAKDSLNKIKKGMIYGLEDMKNMKT